MTNKEKQHYVPKFFLRRFSYQGDERTIGVYNPRTNLFVPRAPLRSQAYRSYFYGKDGILEDELSEVEGVTAELLRRITAIEYPIKSGSADHFSLLVHLMLSDLRTAGAIDRLKALSDNMLDKLFEGQERRPREVQNLEPTTSEDTLKLAMNSLKLSVEFCQDLEIRIIRNTTSTPFITCDDPVLRYNQLLEKYPEVYGSITGTTHVGLQLLLPLDARTLLLAYDSRYYKVGVTRNVQVIECTPEDVDNVNLLSVMSCEQVVFFNEHTYQAYLVKLTQRAARFPRANQWMVTRLYSSHRHGKEEHWTEQEPAISSEMLLHSYTTSLKTNLRLSFLHFTKAGSRFKPYGNREASNMRPHCAAICQRERLNIPRGSVKFTYDD
ncbi:DUF4238 domain-containing protein (plasmid) [Hymenobacter tibetensis]|uniref:DUF4238 domain-containing protein n=1 Tax=Hymenobacter tibetensis TaxID=497967 RepID=A0ABY4D503_9BACT|nr:DUF4238 domain-containing protein [Hymenobacter tibetensis]UOG77422.1 DUF4238 domain-containing protein [Hymenobacter tibetensis]